MTRGRLNGCWLSALLATTLLSSPALAQSQSQSQGADERRGGGEGGPGVASLDDIVVTAAGREQQLREAAASITLIPRVALENQSFHSLTDALRTTPGVAVTGRSDERQISIRGMPGDYTLILVDGRRQNTRETRTNAGLALGVEQGLIPPLEAIERIEVIRGPMSTLYGSDAMGGVVNVITRRLPERWMGSLSVDGSVGQSSDAGDLWQATGYLAGSIVPDRLGVQVWGRYLDREESGLTGGNGGGVEQNITGRLTWRVAPGHDVMLEAGTQEFENIKTSSLTDTRFGDGSRAETKRDFYGVWYDGTFSGDRRVWLSYQNEEAESPTYSRQRGSSSFVRNSNTPRVENQVVDGLFSTPLPFNNTLVVGGHWSNSTLEAVPGGAVTASRFEVGQWALFAENEWRLRDDLALTLGVRRDDHDVYGDHWSPRGYLVWNATDSLVVKGGVSTGFRAPEIRAIAPGFAYPTNGGRDVIVVNPDDPLEPETSVNYELGVYYDHQDWFSGSITLFNTEFKDKIDNATANDGAGNQARWPVNPIYGMWYWSNVDEARIRGVELTGRWEITDAVSLGGGYTYTDSEQRSGAFKGWPLMRTPKHAGNLRLDWRRSDRLSLWGAAYYHGEEINSGSRLGDEGKLIVVIPDPDGGPWPLGSVRRYDAYTTADIGASWRLTPQVLWNVAIYNLFDKELSLNVHNQVNEGRRFWTGVTLRY